MTLMKRIRRLSGPVLALLLSSCSFLEVEKIGKSDISSFFSDVYALEATIYGTSNLAYSFYDSYFLLYPEVAGDLLRLSAPTKEFREQYDFRSLESDESTAVGFIWKKGNEILINANEILSYGPELLREYPAQGARIRNALAMAHFFRALGHFDLVLCYAQHYTYTPDAGHLGVPIMKRLPGLTEPVRRATVAETYASVIDDLRQALGLFSEDYVFDPYFPSPVACKAFLARIHLYMEDYGQAESFASEVIAAPGMALTPAQNYTAMFNKADRPGEEAIFRLSGRDAGKRISNYFLWSNARMLPSEKLLSLFREDADPQHPDVRERLLHHEADDSGICMKYTITDDLPDDRKHTDLFVFRLSEMYLIRAEARCRLGRTEEAARDLALLQARATGREAAEVKPEYRDAAQLDRLIARERMKELFLEGHRLFDLTRRKEDLVRDGKTGSLVQSIAYPDDRFILPIPLVELDANKYMQSNPINGTRQ